MKMGWYKVPQSIFDYAPSVIDPILTDRGIKEGDEQKVPTSLLVRFEYDAKDYVSRVIVYGHDLSLRGQDHRGSSTE